jgi:hypothetical protein
MDYPSFPKKGTNEYKLHRRLEMIPGILTWTTILGTITLSFILPMLAVVLVIIYDIYWFIRVIIISGHSIVAYRQMRKTMKINWLKKCETVKNKELNLNNLYHLIIIPYFNEGLEVLEPAVKSIVDSNYPLKKVIISISGEERAGKEAYERQFELKKKYGKYFKAFLTNVHPIIKGEMPIKANNANYAAKKGVAYIKENKIPIKNVLVSNFDCDTCIHKQYIACTTYNFLKDENRYHQSYQPLPMYNNNIWDTIAIVRLIVLGSTFWHMTESSRPERLVTFSSHSMSLTALIDVGFWKKDVISDDSAIFWQCLCHYSGNYRVKPLYLPVSMDATLAPSFVKTIKNQYKQKRRWAYGIESFPRIIRVFLKDKKISFNDKFSHTFTMLEGHYSWANSSLIILILGWLPLIIGGNEFNETVLSHNIPLITKSILTFGMVGMVLSMFLSLLLLPKKPRRYSKFRYIPMVLQWALLPVIAPIMGIPAIDSQTRLMLGKYFKSFWVSEKFRKQ